MTPDVKPAPVELNQIQARYTAWAKLPATEPDHFPKRNAAWDAYCDARDGLPDGATATKRSLTEATRSSNEDHQFDLFTRRGHA